MTLLEYVMFYRRKFNEKTTRNIIQYRKQEKYN